jgi:hypothetical protein
VKFPIFTTQQFTTTDGNLTPAMHDYHDLLAQALQNGLSDNGWTFPQISAADLVKIAPSMPNGTGWYEKDAHEIVFKINGALRKVTTTVYP